MELTGKQLNTINFRRTRLGDKVAELKALISGREVSFLPQVRTPDGGYSEERTQALLDQLLHALDICKQYRLWSGKEEDPLPPVPAGPEAEGSRRFWRSFLYCAIRVLERCPGWLSNAKGTYAGILHLAEGTRFTDWVDLYYMELYWWPNLDGFFGLMDEAYELLAGQPISSTFREEECWKVQSRYSGEIHEMDLMMQEAQSMDLTPDMLEEMEQALSPEELRQMQEDALWLAREDEEKRAWAQTFPEKETFCREYLLCRDLYFQTSAWKDLSATLEQMLDTHLYLQTGSGFMDDGSFFSAYTLLDRTLTQIRQLSEQRP